MCAYNSCLLVVSVCALGSVWECSSKSKCNEDIYKYPCVPVWHVQVFPCELQQGIQLPCMVLYMLYERV